VLHDLEPNPFEEEAQAANIDERKQVSLADREPSRIELRANALVNRISNYSHMIRGAVPLAKSIGTTAYGWARGTLPMPPLFGPKNRFAQPIGPYRVTEAAMLDLDGFKLIKNVTGTTINDVALVVIAGAMRKYLDKHGELPAESLVAALPLNMRTRREDNHENNQLGSAFTKLHTDIADPIERLMAIHQSANEAKQICETTPLGDVLKIGGMFSPRLTSRFIKYYVDNKLSRHLPVHLSTVISNVPGPNFPLYSCGARLVRYHGLGLLTPGVGLFHLIFSYCGTMSITMLADREILPDPNLYKQCLEDSYQEVKMAAEKLAAEHLAKQPTPVKKRRSASSAQLLAAEASNSSESTAPKLEVVKDVQEVKEAS